MENNFILIENSYLVYGKWFTDLEYGLIFYRTVTSSLNLLSNMLHHH
jgi:hypothetical protein